MSVTDDATGPGPLPAIALPRVSFCHDCCCGTRRKHPDVDHEALRTLLREGLRASAVVSQSACLDMCEDSNVIVVAPSPLGRSQGIKPLWLRKVLSPELVDEVVAWVTDGGPGAAPLPTTLRDHVMKRPAGRA